MTFKKKMIKNIDFSFGFGGTVLKKETPHTKLYPLLFQNGLMVTVPGENTQIARVTSSKQLEQIAKRLFQKEAESRYIILEIS